MGQYGVTRHDEICARDCVNTTAEGHVLHWQRCLSRAFLSLAVSARLITNLGLRPSVCSPAPSRRLFISFLVFHWVSCLFRLFPLPSTSVR